VKEERLYNLMTSRELTWEGLIRDIVTSEGLDPWDIDVALLSNMFVQAVRDLKQKDIRVSGKFLLAAAILLKMKADYLIVKAEEEVEKEEDAGVPVAEMFEYELEPHVPVPKKRKVTMDELINSLRKALVVKERREIRHKEREVEMDIKLKKVDVGEKIRGLYSKIVGFFQKFKLSEIKFSQLIPTKHRWDVIWTFIPLVHLANKGKVKLRQEENFGEIYVRRREETESSD
jgi:segregation and condensation protein A